MGTPNIDGYGNISWQTIAEGIVSPEGPAVDASGNVYLVSRWTGRVLLVEESGAVTEIVQTGGKPQSVALLPCGDLLLADAKNHALCRITPDRALSVVANYVNGQPFLGPNDLLVADDEVVYMTDPGLDLEAPGQILRIETRTGQTTVLADGYQFPNGIALSTDGCHLMVAESLTHRVLKFSLLDGGKRLGPPDVFCEFADHYPDGIAFDAEGNLLVTLHGEGSLHVINPQGMIVASIPTGGKGITNCVFGGPDFQTLYVTEDDQQAVLATHWPVPGQRRFSRSGGRPVF